MPIYLSLFFITMDIVKHPTAHQRPTAQTAPAQSSFLHTKHPPIHQRSVESFDDYVKRTRLTEPKKRRSRIPIGKFLLWCAVILFTGSIVWTCWMTYTKTNETFAHMSDNGEKHSVLRTISNIANPHSYESLKGFDDGRINILLLGRANTHKAGKDLTDTIMLASINTKDYTVGLFSLPRDLLVMHDGAYGKINALYQSGVRNDVGAQYITDVVGDVTDQEIHYYIVMDFEGFTKIIDILEGINVDVPRHIKDERYPGPGYSYETFEVYPGLQQFNGETALKYARTRHDVEGDFGRAKRQQQIMQAAKNKAFSLGTIVNPMRIAEIFDVLGEHIHTDISPNEIEPFIALTKKLDTQNITTVVVDAWQPGSLLISARQGNASGLLPRIGNYKEIRERAQNIFDLTRIAQREKDISSENSTITLFNRSGDASLPTRVTSMLRTIGFTSVTIHTPKLKRNETLADLEETTIIDRTTGAKPFSLDELLKKVPAKKGSETIADTEADFVIILGKDILPNYTYTEITQDELEKKDDPLNNDTHL